jgi:hypothetical protein
MFSAFPDLANDPIDLAATATFLALVLLVPLAGYVFMVLDFRAYLRSLKRGLVLASQAFAGIPAWARPYTPRAIAALGLRLPCTEEDLKRAYRQRVKLLHPDHGGDERRFLLLQAQFEEALVIVAEIQQGFEGGGAKPTPL